jgi:hypothetical protein
MLYVTPKQKNVSKLQKEPVLHAWDTYIRNLIWKRIILIDVSVTFLGTSRIMMQCLKIIFPSSYLLLLRHCQVTAV